MEPVIILGDRQPSGAYLLRLRLAETLHVRCRRLQGGAAIAFPAGDYLYIGSAMSQRGASSLARRLLRHTARSSQRQPQAIQAAVLSALSQAGLGAANLAPPDSKRLHWNIDYLLDEDAVVLAQVYALCSPQPLEFALAKLLTAAAETRVPVPGFGAHDHRGQTHLLQVEAGEDWWLGLESELERLLTEWLREA